MKHIFLSFILAWGMIGCGGDDYHCDCQYWYETKSLDGHHTYVTPSHNAYNVGDTITKENSSVIVTYIHILK
jgi:hypothetical protein